MFGERLAFELSRAELSLQIDERPLDLHVNDLVRERDHQVRRTQISGCDGDLKRDPRTGMSRSADRRGDLELSGVAQAHRPRGVQAPAKFKAAGRDQPATCDQRYVDSAPLRPTHLLLRTPRKPTDLKLGEPHPGPRDPEFAPEPTRKVVGPLASDRR